MFPKAPALASYTARCTLPDFAKHEEQNEKPDMPSPYADRKACDTLSTLLCPHAFMSCSHLGDLLEGLIPMCRSWLT